MVACDTWGTLVVASFDTLKAARCDLELDRPVAASKPLTLMLHLPAHERYDQLATEGTLLGYHWLRLPTGHLRFFREIRTFLVLTTLGFTDAIVPPVTVQSRDFRLTARGVPGVNKKRPAGCESRCIQLLAWYYIMLTFVKYY